MTELQKELNLADEQSTAKRLEAAKESETPFDWETEFRTSSLTHYSEFWSDSLSYFNNVRSLHNRAIWLGDEHTQEVVSHVVSAYALSHSVAMQFCPILFYCGVSGSAKSESGKFIAAIRESEKDILGAQCTFASVRNVINANRWYHYSEHLHDTSLNNERATVLVWADIKEADLLENRQLYSLMRNGCDRKEDRLLIASEGGMNKEFYVFCPKIISSVESFYSYPKWSELKRRIILVKTKVLDDSLSAELFRENQLVTDTVDFNGISRKFNDFWCRESLLKLGDRRKNSKAKSLMLKAKFSEHEIKASYDLLLQHSVLNDCAVSESIAIFREYWLIAYKWLEIQDFSLESILQGLLSEYFQTKVDGIPLCIEHGKCVSALKDSHFTAKASDIGAFMISKGFKPAKKAGKQFWVEEMK